jgi:hypothetical protein
LVGCVLLMAACVARPALDRDETELVAWWIEDSCRGVARTAAELQTEDPSAGLQRIAEWAATRGQGAGLPPQLAARKARWPVVRAFLADGSLVPAEDGLVTAPAAATGDTAVLARSVARDENRDRLTAEVVVLGVAKEDVDGTRRLRSALRAARIAADRDAARR